MLTFSKPELTTLLSPILLLMSAALAGGLLGVVVARAKNLGKNIGERQTIGTFGLVMVGAALFGQIGHQSPPESFQLIAGIATGSGFIAGALIFRSPGEVQGTTTAALLWGSSAVGLAFGLEQLALALAGALCLTVISWFHERDYPDLRWVERLVRDARRQARGPKVSQHGRGGRRPPHDPPNR